MNSSSIPNEEISYSIDGDPRSVARRAALQFLYQLVVQNGGPLDRMESFLAEYAAHKQSQPLAKEWILGTWRNMERIDQIIQQISTNREPDRIDLVDRCNLRLGIYQLLYCPDIPHKVVINEAVELAKTFSTAHASNFINGILDTVHKKIKDGTLT